MTACVAHRLCNFAIIISVALVDPIQEQGSMPRCHANAGRQNEENTNMTKKTGIRSWRATVSGVGPHVVVCVCLARFMIGLNVVINWNRDKLRCWAPTQDKAKFSRSTYSTFCSCNRIRVHRIVHMTVLPPTYTRPSRMSMRRADSNSRARAPTSPTITRPCAEGISLPTAHIGSLASSRNRSYLKGYFAF